MNSSYYFPDLTVDDESRLLSRLTWMKDLEQHNEHQIIRFRQDMKDCEYLFLCDVWPDVKHQRPTCKKWGIPINKFPLIEVKNIGSFRTLRHFYYYNFFQTIDSNYARYFLWSSRHDAANVYQKFVKDKYDKKIERESKKARPKISNIDQWKAEFHLISERGLPAQHAIRLASWSCCKDKLKISLSMKDFNAKVLDFQNHHGIRVYAFGIAQMYAQDERLKKALIGGTKDLHLFSIGTYQKEIWSTNSGHNLLGELHMHFRSNPTVKFFNLYVQKCYCYSTSGRICPSDRKKPPTRSDSTIPDQRQQLFSELNDEMIQQAKQNNWNQVRKLARSIEYLTILH